jgi:hypothetical protein
MHVSIAQTFDSELLIVFFFLPSTSLFTSFFLVCRYQIPEAWPFEEARRLFKEPLVTTEEDQLNLKWNPPDEEVALQMQNVAITSCILKLVLISCDLILFSNPNFAV